MQVSVELGVDAPADSGAHGMSMMRIMYGIVSP